ncbi:DUF389 domain-containing protein [Streptomyces sp. NBC_01335]|uniref:DUF389 domain-containing protein n=1 Tax=Streptomyces sp. NBC_01335 TaxID=2903828 RepID=UPI002E165F75|nr:DUF389 domain-containing protein [Streptomyces sp. NBC_01335]
MAGIEAAAAQRMADTLFIEPPWRSPSSTRFWCLLVLAAVIAGAGVVGDSSATVIGAMIVAPLMTPILGSALALVLADRRHVVRSVLLVTGGALAVVLIGMLLGWIVSRPDGFASNSQVSSRITPRLIDLVAALATGTVGAFALVRTDISDALPGVAIAISLVPPLSVTGLLITAHRYHDAGQSALLFATNVTAIVATGTVVFLCYGVRNAATAAKLRVGEFRGRTLAAVIVVLLLVAVPLTIGSVKVARDRLLAADAQPVAERWAEDGNWQIASVDARDGVVVIGVVGLPPQPAPAALREALDRGGLSGADLELHLVGGRTQWCPAGGDTCTVRHGGLTGARGRSAVRIAVAGARGTRAARTEGRRAPAPGCGSAGTP